MNCDERATVTDPVRHLYERILSQRHTNSAAVDPDRFTVDEGTSERGAENAAL